MILARREGAGSHDTILAACAAAGFTPHLVHTPSVIGTILRYVEAGSGIGILPESVKPESEEVVSTALGGDWEFRGIRTPSKDLYPSTVEEKK